MEQSGIDAFRATKISSVYLTTLLHSLQSRFRTTLHHFQSSRTTPVPSLISGSFLCPSTLVWTSCSLLSRSMTSRSSYVTSILHLPNSQWRVSSGTALTSTLHFVTDPLDTSNIQKGNRQKRVSRDYHCVRVVNIFHALSKGRYQSNKPALNLAGSQQRVRYIKPEDRILFSPVESIMLLALQLDLPHVQTYQ